MDDFTTTDSTINLRFDALSGRFLLTALPIVVTVENDDIVEGDEEFTLNLVQGAVLGNRDIVVRSPNVSRIIIIDNDGKNYNKQSHVTL